MKKIEIYAKDRNLETVTITSGCNGYPSNLREAVVFDTQDEAESFAREIGGDVVLLQRRDGWQYYEELGIIFLPYRFGVKDFTPDCMKYDTEAEPYVVNDLSDYRWALKEENDFIREMPDETALMIKDANVVKELATFKEGDCMFLRFINGEQFFDTFRAGQTCWHDADVTEYQLAVVPQ